MSELIDGREPFGARLANAMAGRGPLCVGIDPHPGLLAQWGLNDDIAGLERFSMTVVEALADRVAVLKPQCAFSSSGTVLEAWRCWNAFWPRGCRQVR